MKKLITLIIVFFLYGCAEYLPQDSRAEAIRKIEEKEARRQEEKQKQEAERLKQQEFVRENDAKKEQIQDKVESELNKKGLSQYLENISFASWNKTKAFISGQMNDKNLTEFISNNLYSCTPAMIEKTKNIKNHNKNSILYSGYYEPLEAPASVIYIFNNKEQLIKQIMVVGNSYYLTGFSWDGELTINDKIEYFINDKLNFLIGQCNVDYGLSQSLGKDKFFWHTEENASLTIEVEKGVTLITFKKE